MNWIKENWFKLGLLVVALVSIFLYFGTSENQVENLTSDGDFQKKQECASFDGYQLADTRIQNSGRLLKNDTYKVEEIFYSPQIESCLYAWKLYTPIEPYTIYSIDDLFSGEIFTAGISLNASELWLAEIKRLKQ